MLSISLFVSLSGCAGSGWGTWNNNWNNNWSNITGGVRNYGQYPTPNAQTCFINPTLVAAKQQGLENLASQKAREGIPAILLVKNYLIPATNQLAVQGNAQPLNALFAQIQPPTLANFMIGCNEVMVQERQQLIQERQQLIQDVNNLSNKIATLQQYLNTTPAPQPTAETCSDNYILNTNAYQAAINIAEIYEGKPALLYLKLILYTPYQPVLLEKLLNIKTLQGLQNFQQQLQKDHLLTNGTVPSIPPAPPPINWEQYKATFSSVLTGALKRALGIVPTGSVVAKTEQQLQGVHQQLQGIHQQLQEVHQLSQQAHLGPQGIGSFGTPQEILNTVESIHLPGLPPPPGLSGIINYEKAAIASQNGNFIPLIAIYKQVQPQTWRNYFVGCYKKSQQARIKAKVDTVP